MSEIKAYDGKGAYIFVSYAHKDREIVYPLIAELQKRYNVWFDEGIPYTTEYRKVLASRLKNCSLFLYMVTPASLESDFCGKEIAFATKHNKPFINILMEKFELPDWFEFDYDVFQYCRYYEFASPESAAADLERKCGVFETVKKDDAVIAEPPAVSVAPVKNANDGKSGYLYLSYAYRDKARVLPFIKELQKRYNVWYDEGISYGAEWGEENAAKLKGCSGFVCLISEASLASVTCRDELDAARKLGKPLLHVCFDKDVDFPQWFIFRYGIYQLFNVYGFQSYEAAVEEVGRKCGWLESVKKDGDKTDCWAVGSIVCLGSYVQQEFAAPKPIEWQVLAVDGYKALLISKYAIDCQKFKSTSAEGIWKTCSLRKWLNNTFLYDAFDMEEQNMIVDTTVTADNNPEWCSVSGSVTRDKIFLLSLDEAETLFGLDDERKCLPTDYTLAKLKSKRHRVVPGEKNACKWWLRTPGINRESTAIVSEDGSFYTGGVYYGKSEAVRPAMWVRIEP